MGVCVTACARVWTRACVRECVLVCVCEGACASVRVYECVREGGGEHSAGAGGTNQYYDLCWLKCVQEHSSPMNVGLEGGMEGRHIKHYIIRALCI